MHVDVYIMYIYIYNTYSDENCELHRYKDINHAVFNYRNKKSNLGLTCCALLSDCPAISELVNKTRAFDFVPDR